MTRSNTEIVVHTDRRGRQLVPQDAGISHRQKMAIARVTGAAAKAALRATYMAQNRNSRGQAAMRNRARQSRVSMPRTLSMPTSRAHGKAQFESSDVKSMMQEAWKMTPASSNLIAPRGLGYYDAFNTPAISSVTHMSIGPATPIDAKTTCGGGAAGSVGIIDTGLTKHAQLLIVQPCADEVQAVLYKIGGNGDPLTLVDSVSYRSPQLQADAPVETIPVRCSLRIGNYTASINQGGIVRVLRMTTGINLTAAYTTNEALLNLMEGIRDHKRTRQYKGCQFDEDLQKNCTVCDQSRSLRFQNFGQTVSSNDIPWLQVTSGTPPVVGPPTPETQVHPFARELYDPSYTPIAILFEAFQNVQPGTGGPQGNTYQVVVQSQFLAHYKQGTMLANLAFNPDNNSALLSKHQNMEEAKGSAMEKVMHAVQSAGKFVWNHRGDLATLAPLLV